MKSILNETEYQEIRKRIENLQPQMERQWGKMDVAQMLAHCNIPLEQAIGKTQFKDESNFLSRTLIRWIVLKKVKQGDFGQNAPTVKSFVVSDARNFEQEKQRLLENIAVLYKKGNETALPPHPGFGKMSNEQWGSLQYVHLDHHLKQFSA